MTSRVSTVAFQGIEAVPVDVQAQFVAGQVQFHVVGLPDKAVAESRERVRAAIGGPKGPRCPLGGRLAVLGAEGVATWGPEDKASTGGSEFSTGGPGFSSTPPQVSKDPRPERGISGDPW